MFSGVFIAEEANAAGDDTITVDVHTDTLSGFFEHVPETCLFQ